MIKITEDRLKSGILKALEQFERDCEYILNNTKSSTNVVRSNILDMNKESALGKISIIMWLCEYDEEIVDMRYYAINSIYSMHNKVFNEIWYKDVQKER